MLSCHLFPPDSPAVASINASAKSAKGSRAVGAEEEAPGPIFLTESIRDHRSTTRTLETGQKAPKPCQERNAQTGAQCASEDSYIFQVPEHRNQPSYQSQRYTSSTHTSQPRSESGNGITHTSHHIPPLKFLSVLRQDSHVQNIPWQDTSHLKNNSGATC